MYAPITPGGTVLYFLQKPTEDQAWKALLEDASHMPYKGKEGFMQRGYTVEELHPDEEGI